MDTRFGSSECKFEDLGVEDFSFSAELEELPELLDFVISLERRFDCLNIFSDELMR